jgi:hypothetical protein
MNGPHADAVQASIHAHDPAADHTLTKALDSLNSVHKREAAAPAAVSNPWVSAP